MGASQLPLALPHQPALARADFLVGNANYTALAAVEAWQGWPGGTALLSGPSGAGKTHLVAIWRALSGAAGVAAADVRSGDAERLLVSGALAIEDVDSGPVDETALFHVVNLSRQRGASLLMTARCAASSLRIGLPDLLSRLRAVQPLAVAAPDDDLLGRVLMKLFSDRQITVDPPLVDYLLRRVERSFAAANAVVDRLDREALAAGRSVTRTFAAAVLDAGPTTPTENGNRSPLDR